MGMLLKFTPEEVQNATKGFQSAEVEKQQAAAHKATAEVCARVYFCSTRHSEFDPWKNARQNTEKLKCLQWVTLMRSGLLILDMKVVYG